MTTFLIGDELKLTWILYFLRYILFHFEKRTQFGLALYLRYILIPFLKGLGGISRLPLRTVKTYTKYNAISDTGNSSQPNGIIYMIQHKKPLKLGLENE